MGVACPLCLGDGGRGGGGANERVITVGIGWVLLASTISGFSGYIKLLLCQGASVAQLVRASDWYSEGVFFSFRGFFTLSKGLKSLHVFTIPFADLQLLQNNLDEALTSKFTHN